MDEPNLTRKRINLDAPIGDIIRQLRESQRYNQADIARMIKCSRNHISDIEAMKGFPSYAKLVEILRVLGYELTVRRIKKQHVARKAKADATATSETPNPTQ